MTLRLPELLTQAVREVRVGAWREVPISALSDPRRTRDDLEFPNPLFVQNTKDGRSNQGVPPTVQMWSRRGDTLLVPRHYKPSLSSQIPTRPTFVPNVGVAPFRATATPRDKEQEESVRWLSDKPVDSRLMERAGRGKTTMSLMAIARLKISPVLVVVHEQATMQQWINRMVEQTSLERDDIGIIQGPRADFPGKKVAVAMMHTLALRDSSWPKLSAWIKGGLQVFDELDVYPAMKMSRCLSLFEAVRWGLTATYRNDADLQRLLELHVGPRELYRSGYELDPLVVSCKVNVGDYASRYRNINTLITSLEVTNKKWRDTIKDLATESASSGRKTLLLMQRTEGIESITAELVAAGVDAGFIHGGVKGKERLARLAKHRVVVANRKIAGRALDQPDISTIITMPTSNPALMEQIAGRALRVKKGKSDPIIIMVFPATKRRGQALGIFQGMMHKSIRALAAAGMRKTKLVER